MKVQALVEIPSARGTIPAGAIIEIADSLLLKLRGRVAPLPLPPASSRPYSLAWLTPEGELRSSGIVNDLATEIVKLTADNLTLQRELLIRHCEQFDRHHISDLWEAWEERTAIMQYDGGMSREEAEQEAAKLYHLQSFYKPKEIQK